MVSNKNNFGKRIKQLRGELTMKEFGNKIGEKVSTISAWENGNSIPISSKLVTIAKAFNVSVDYLLGLTDNPQLNNVEHMEWNVLEHMRNIEDIEVIHHYMQLICELSIMGNEIDSNSIWRILSAKYLTFYYVKYREQLEQSQTMQWMDFLIYVKENPYTKDEIDSTLSTVGPLSDICKSDPTWEAVRGTSLIFMTKIMYMFHPKS